MEFSLFDLLDREEDILKSFQYKLVFKKGMVKELKAVEILIFYYIHFI
jgi:hypothetical protein